VDWNNRKNTIAVEIAEQFPPISLLVCEVK